jgi:polyisoprenyl-phosphate glycosyltransferase
MHSEAMVTVVAPLQDDELILRDFVAEASAVLGAHYTHYEIVLVDDGSTDNTAGVAEELLETWPCLRLIRLTRRFGTDVAVTAGLEVAIGDYTVVMRPRADPPQEVPALIAQAAETRGLVFGVAPRRSERGLLVQLSRRAFFWILRRAVGLDLPFDATGFYALTRPALNAVTRVKSKHRHMDVLSCAIGFRAERHAYAQIDRSPSHTRRPLREAINEAIGDLVSHSVLPLRLASNIGIFAAMLNLLYVGYIAAVNLIKQRVAEGWTTLSLQHSAMFFFLFCNMTILSEYIARILQESQDQPLYHVLDDRTSSVRDDKAERRNVA